MRVESLRDESDAVRGRGNDLWAGVGALKARRRDGESLDWAIVDEDGMRQVLEVSLVLSFVVALLAGSGWQRGGNGTLTALHDPGPRRPAEGTRPPHQDAHQCSGRRRGHQARVRTHPRSAKRSVGWLVSQDGRRLIQLVWFLQSSSPRSLE